MNFCVWREWWVYATVAIAMLSCATMCLSVIYLNHNTVVLLTNCVIIIEYFFLHIRSMSICLCVCGKSQEASGWSVISKWMLFFGVPFDFVVCSKFRSARAESIRMIRTKCYSIEYKTNNHSANKFFGYRNSMIFSQYIWRLHKLLNCIIKLHTQARQPTFGTRTKRQHRKHINFLIYDRLTSHIEF